MADFTKVKYLSKLLCCSLIEIVFNLASYSRVAFTQLFGVVAAMLGHILVH